MTEDDTFKALKRESFSSLFIRVLDQSRSTPCYNIDDYMEMVSQRKSMVAAAGWTYEEFNKRIVNHEKETGKEAL